MPAWRQEYRSLEHGPARNACQDGRMTRFPREIQDFADAFVSMQAKRHAADYDPIGRAYKSAVLIDIASVEAVMDGFENAPLKDRRAFAAWVLFKLPKT
jgi:hypothetical protein